MQKSPYITLMERAAVKAGKSLARDFNEVENLQVSKKGPGDFVSAADRRAESIIIEELEKGGHGYSVLSEECGEIEGKTDEYTWVIDPLDGTTNFLHGIPYFCTSIGLVKNLKTDPQPVAGLIFAPILQEMFWGERGQGAIGNNRRMMVSSRQKIDEALCATYVWKDHPSNKHNMKLMTHFSKSGTTTRILGSSALDMAYLAAGKIDVFWCDFVRPWDVAAGLLLIKEARGIATTISGGGEKEIIQTGGMLAANNVLYDQFHKAISSEYENN